MCSILGMVALPGCTVSNSEAQRIFGNLLMAGMSRGVDATGMAWKSRAETEKEIVNIHKAPLPADEFVEKRLSYVWPEYLPQVVIGHTRASTKGSEMLNVNNHPVFDARSGIAVVHNGHIVNDDPLFRKYRMERKGEVDSEAIPKLIGYHYWDGDAGVRGDIDGSIKAACEELGGGFAFLLISAYHPGVLWLVKNHNPASICYLPDIGLMLIASADGYFTEALGAKQVWLGFFEKWVCSDRMLITEVGNDTILRINYASGDIDQVITQTNFKSSTATYGYSGSYWNLYDEWSYVGQSKKEPIKGGSVFDGDMDDWDEYSCVDPMYSGYGMRGCVWQVGGHCMNPEQPGIPTPCTGDIFHCSCSFGGGI